MQNPSPTDRESRSVPSRFRVGTAGGMSMVLATLLGVVLLGACGQPDHDQIAPAGNEPEAPADEPPASQPAVTAEQSAANTEGVATSEDDDARLRELCVGTWEDDYQGKRTMQLREDGTAMMVVELSGWKAALVAHRLEFDMVWSVREGRVQMQSLGGRPEDKVRMILKMKGDRVDEPILEVTGERLLLLDADGITRYDWRRVR